MQHELEGEIYHLQRTICELQNKKQLLLLKFKQLLDEEIEITRRRYMEKTRFVWLKHTRVNIESQDCNGILTFQCLLGRLNDEKEMCGS